jgi:hypothetical protein
MVGRLNKIRPPVGAALGVEVVERRVYRRNACISSEQEPLLRQPDVDDR